MGRFRTVYKANVTRLSRFINYIKDEDIGRTIKKIMKFIKEWIYLKFEGYYCIVNPLFVISEPGEDVYEIKEVNEPYDLSHLFDDLTFDGVKIRLNDGQFCFVAFFDDKPIATMWLTVKQTYFPDFVYRIVSRSKWISLAHGSGFIYRAAVEKEFRKKNIFIALHNVAAKKAKNIGVKRLITSIGKDNVPVRKAVIKVGYKIRNLVVCKRICGIVYRKFIIDDNCSI